MGTGQGRHVFERGYFDVLWWTTLNRDPTEKFHRLTRKLQPRNVVTTLYSTARPTRREAHMFDMETWPHTTAVMTEITVGPAVRQIPQPQSRRYSWTR